jgi:hypothetical protein
MGKENAFWEDVNANQVLTDLIVGRVCVQCYAQVTGTMKMEYAAVFPDGKASNVN